MSAHTQHSPFWVLGFLERYLELIKANTWGWLVGADTYAELTATFAQNCQFLLGLKCCKGEDGTGDDYQAEAGMKPETVYKLIGDLYRQNLEQTMTTYINTLANAASRIPGEHEARYFWLPLVRRTVSSMAYPAPIYKQRLFVRLLIECAFKWVGRQPPSSSSGGDKDRQAAWRKNRKEALNDLFGRFERSVAQELMENEGEDWDTVRTLRFLEASFKTPARDHQQALTATADVVLRATTLKIPTDVTDSRQLPAVLTIGPNGNTVPTATQGSTASAEGSRQPRALFRAQYIPEPQAARLRLDEAQAHQDWKDMNEVQKLLGRLDGPPNGRGWDKSWEERDPAEAILHTPGKGQLTAHWVQRLDEHRRGIKRIVRDDDPVYYYSPAGQKVKRRCRPRRG